MDNDTVLQGVVISMFSLCVFGTIVKCVRSYLTPKPNLKQSTSQTDLMNLESDPQQV